MSKLPQITGLAVLFIFSTLSISKATCDPPACSKELPHCINHNNCETVRPALRVFDLEGKTFVVGPANQVDLEKAPDKKLFEIEGKPYVIAPADQVDLKNPPGNK